MLILGIETSCDETAASVVEIKRGRFNIISNIVSSQIKIHKKYGGVVPELAARKHTENIIPVIDKALSKIPPLRKVGLGDFKKKVLDTQAGVRRRYPNAIAVVCGPGLATSLMVGVETAKALAWAWKIPLIPINHLEAHICANWLTMGGRLDASNCWYAPPATQCVKLNSICAHYQRENCNSSPLHRIKCAVRAGSDKCGGGVIKFPAICLLISGGHTELVLMKNFKKYKIIGETVDDAAGEAFDKVAKLLNLPYPGGPNVAKLARKHSYCVTGCDRNSFNSTLISGPSGVLNFPRPLINSNNFNFSFSGLKTAVRQIVTQPSLSEPALSLPKGGLCGNGGWGVNDICASFQQAVIDVLINKTIKAAQKFKVKTIMLAGGVAANQELRKQMAEKIKSELPESNFIFPDKQFCTDNAAMTAVAGHFHYNKNLKPYNLEKIGIDPNLKLCSL